VAQAPPTSASSSPPPLYPAAPRRPRQRRACSLGRVASRSRAQASKLDSLLRARAATAATRPCRAAAPAQIVFLRSVSPPPARQPAVTCAGGTPLLRRQGGSSVTSVPRTWWWRDGAVRLLRDVEAVAGPLVSRSHDGIAPSPSMQHYQDTSGRFLGLGRHGHGAASYLYGRLKKSSTAECRFKTSE
jgi:hypothetical protein